MTLAPGQQKGCEAGGGVSRKDERGTHVLWGLGVEWP